MAKVSDVTLWHTLSFRDADRMMAWLSACGFVEHSTYRDDADSSVVLHAEWVWPPGGGGVMFGTQRSDADTDDVGRARAYLVTDDPDGVVDRAVTAGATLLDPVADQGHGGRSGGVTDPEGNRWSFGSYRPF